MAGDPAESEFVPSEILHIRSPLGTRYADHIVLFGKNDWQHPWLRVCLVLREMLETRWGGEQWQAIKREIPTALGEKGRIQRQGWFN